MAKRRRRVEVPCLLCSAGTLDVDAICDACRTIYREGQQFRQMAAAKEDATKVYVFGPLNLLHTTVEPYSQYASESSHFATLIRRILFDRVMPEEIVGKERYFGMPHVLTAQFYAPTYYVRLTDDQRAALGELVTFIQAVINAAKAKARTDGRRFLYGLATGETSIDDFNKLSIKAK